MRDIEAYNSDLNGVVSEISGYSDARSAIKADPNYSEEYKLGQIERLLSESSSSIQEAFRAIRNRLEQETEEARSMVDARPTDFAEQMYQALAASQDADGRTPEELLSIYQGASKAGSPSYLRELERIVDPLMQKSGLLARWEALKTSCRSPEQREAARMVTTSEAICSNLSVLENHAAYLLENAHRGQHVDPGELHTVWQQLLANAGDMQ